MGACTDKVAFDKQIQSGIVEDARLLNFQLSKKLTEQAEFAGVLSFYEKLRYLTDENRFMGACTDKVAFDKQIQSGIVEELVTLRTYKS